jgi:hypothetical protein
MVNEQAARDKISQAADKAFVFRSLEDLLDKMKDGEQICEFAMVLLVYDGENYKLHCCYDGGFSADPVKGKKIMGDLRDAFEKSLGEACDG